MGAAFNVRSSWLRPESAEVASGSQSKINEPQLQVSACSVQPCDDWSPTTSRPGPRGGIERICSEGASEERLPTCRSG